MLRYFGWAYAVTIAGLVLAFWLGLQYFGTLSGALGFLMIGIVLAVLEISLSFDNAIVNANKLKTMDPVWQRRFLTWGILIAVFGMRIIFPLLIVVFAARIGPFEAIRLAATEPARYAAIINDAHLSIAAFGGTFLMMVALTWFIDESKEIDWIATLEKGLRKFGSVRSMEIALVLLVMIGFSYSLPAHESSTFLHAGIFGLLTFLGVELLNHVLDKADAAGQRARADAAGQLAKGGLGAFLYLEVLDASFSFDGVIGAFALTQNLFLIAIGLGIGAMYVRSMTVMLVERETLAEFRYLEHGAFWSILILSVIMFAQTLVHIPEIVTGLIGAAFIGFSFMSSLRHNKTVREGG
jgi:uncharacterized protein